MTSSSSRSAATRRAAEGRAGGLLVGRRPTTSTASSVWPAVSRARPPGFRQRRSTCSPEARRLVAPGGRRVSDEHASGLLAAPAPPPTCTSIARYAPQRETGNRSVRSALTTPTTYTSGKVIAPSPIICVPTSAFAFQSAGERRAPRSRRASSQQSQRRGVSSSYQTAGPTTSRSGASAPSHVPRLLHAPTAGEAAENGSSSLQIKPRRPSPRAKSPRRRRTTAGPVSPQSRCRPAARHSRGRPGR